MVRMTVQLDNSCFSIHKLTVCHIAACRFVSLSLPISPLLKSSSILKIDYIHVLKSAGLSKNGSVYRLVSRVMSSVA